MTTAYTEYDNEGRFHGVIWILESELSSQLTEHSLLSGAHDGKTHYLLSDDITIRPTMSNLLDVSDINADGVDKATISNCPENSEVFMNGDNIGIVGSDGLIEITSFIPKVMSLQIIMFPYLTWIGVINAT